MIINNQCLEKIAQAVSSLITKQHIGRGRPTGFPQQVSSKPPKSDAQSLHNLGSDLYKPQDAQFAMQNIQATGGNAHEVDKRIFKRPVGSDIKRISKQGLMTKNTATVSPLAPRSFL